MRYLFALCLLRRVTRAFDFPLHCQHKGCPFLRVLFGKGGRECDRIMGFCALQKPPRSCATGHQIKSMDGPPSGSCPASLISFFHSLSPKIPRNCDEQPLLKINSASRLEPCKQTLPANRSPARRQPHPCARKAQLTPYFRIFCLQVLILQDFAGNIGGTLHLTPMNRRF